VDDKTNEIKQRIDEEREQLGRNFDEIEDRVRGATDLKGFRDAMGGRCPSGAAPR